MNYSTGQLEQKILELVDTVKSKGTDSIRAEKTCVDEVIARLDQGTLRVCEYKEQSWQVNAWVKEAILLYFRLQPMHAWSVGEFHYYDKIPLKKNFAESNVRAVPPCTVRYGAHLEPHVILMPSYVNIGAYVGENTMVDTWATVGSCAQVGKNVHLSGGVGIGGVLEPASARPVIIEDGAFIGSRAIIVEGVHVGKEAVLAANVTLTSSTPVIDTRGSEFKEFKGFIPPRCVVVPGVKEKKLAHGVIHTSCAYIIGERKASTDLKTSLNQTLRDYEISV